MDHIENTVLLLLRACALARKRVYRTVAQKRPFVYSSIAYQLLYSLFVSRFLPSNGSIRHNISKEYILKITLFASKELENIYYKRHPFYCLFYFQMLTCVEHIFPA
jgi:hypothetical protein